MEYRAEPLGQLVKSMKWSFPTEEEILSDSGIEDSNLQFVEAKKELLGIVSSLDPDSIPYKTLFDALQQFCVASRTAWSNLFHSALLYGANHPTVRNGAESFREAIEEGKPTSVKAVEFLGNWSDSDQEEMAILAFGYLRNITTRIACVRTLLDDNGVASVYQLLIRDDDHVPAVTNLWADGAAYALADATFRWMDKALAFLEDEAESEKGPFLDSREYHLNGLRKFEGLLRLLIEISKDSKLTNGLNPHTAIYFYDLQAHLERTQRLLGTFNLKEGWESNFKSQKTVREHQQRLTRFRRDISIALDTLHRRKRVAAGQKVSIRVLLETNADRDLWHAHCLDYNFTVNGASKEETVDKMQQLVEFSFGYNSDGQSLPGPATASKFALYDMASPSSEKTTSSDSQFEVRIFV